jgi:glycosyltransferase involved in cell wall biosynthesis
LAGYISHDDLVDLYQRAWVLTNGSIAEGWGMSITEAAACGTPAVVTDIAGHRDAVDEGRSGLLVDGQRGLTEGLITVLTDDLRREQLTNGALERAAQLTWHATAIGTLAALVDDAHRRRRTGSVASGTSSR